MEVFQIYNTHSRRLKLVARNYILSLERKKGNKYYWYCSHNRGCCKGRAVTHIYEEQHIAMKFIEHNHPAPPHAFRVTQLVNEVKYNAKNTENPPNKIVQDAVVSISNTERPHIPTVQALYSKIRRIRQELRPKEPQTPTEINVNPELKITCNKQPFLIIDVTLEGDRILVFSTVADLTRLAQRHWIMDCVTKTAPPIFYQLCTIHTKVGSLNARILPMVYILMTSKSQAAYVKAMEEIRNFAAGNGTTLAPQVILSNLEREAINAIEIVFPEVENKVCFFHFEDSFWRNIQSYGLTERYHSDADFAFSINQLTALAFVPLENIPQAFDEVENTMPVEAHVMVEWMKENYVHGKEQVLPDGTVTQTPPVFPPKMWCVYNMTTHGIPRTQSSIEYWHRRLETFVGRTSVGVFKIIETFQKEQHKMEGVVGLISESLPRPREKYVIRKGKKIAAMVREYHTRELLDYIKGLALNLEVCFQLINIVSMTF